MCGRCPAGPICRNTVHPCQPPRLRSIPFVTTAAASIGFAWLLVRLQTCRRMAGSAAVKKFFQVIWFVLPLLIVMACAAAGIYVLMQFRIGHMRLT
jgi:hypothetical protein